MFNNPFTKSTKNGLFPIEHEKPQPIQPSNERLLYLSVLSTENAVWKSVANQPKPVAVERLILMLPTRGIYHRRAGETKLQGT